MTFTFKCYQNNFMINNLNIVSFGDCFGSIIACMAFALLIELSRGINLYLRNYSITKMSNDSSMSRILTEKSIRTRRILLHILSTIVHLIQTVLSYILMLMVMNNFAGFLLSAVIALGIGYYLLNGVHPYTHSSNHIHSSYRNNETTNPINTAHYDNEPIMTTTTTSSSEQILPINS